MMIGSRVAIDRSACLLAEHAAADTLTHGAKPGRRVGSNAGTAPHSQH